MNGSPNFLLGGSPDFKTSDFPTHIICHLSVIPLVWYSVFKTKSQDNDRAVIMTIFLLMTFLKFSWKAVDLWLFLVSLLTSVVKMSHCIFCSRRKNTVNFQGYFYPPFQSLCVMLTSLAGPAQVARPGAVADVAVPALSADAVVLAGVGQALFGLVFGARRLHAHRSLRLGQPPDVFALPVHKQVSDAAYVAIVQQSRPNLKERLSALSCDCRPPGDVSLKISTLKQVSVFSINAAEAGDGKAAQASYFSFMQSPTSC